MSDPGFKGTLSEPNEASANWTGETSGKRSAGGRSAARRHHQQRQWQRQPSGGASHRRALRSSFPSTGGRSWRQQQNSETQMCWWVSLIHNVFVFLINERHNMSRATFLQIFACYLFSWELAYFAFCRMETRVTKNLRLVLQHWG